MSNPYQSPQSYGQPPYGSPSGFPGGEDREKMRSVARYQRLVMYALLANIGLNVLSFALPGRDNLAVALVILAGALVVVGFSITAMFLLANTLHNPIIGGVCAFLMLIPCVALITLLVINQQASSYLSTRGVKVGFLGADPNSI